MTTKYDELFDTAKRLGLHPELVTGNILHRNRASGQVAEWRAIVELRLTAETKVVACERMNGLGDRNRAAEALLERHAFLKR